MQDNIQRSPLTAALVLGGVIFGMVLAGGTDLVPSVSAAPEGNARTGGVVVSPQGLGLPSFADLAEVVSPAVVAIQATKISSGNAPTSRDALEFFFGPRMRPNPRGTPEERRSDSTGSGFVISPDGLIVTNHHVIEDATDLKVFLEGREYPAKVRGKDPATDIALLEIEPEGELTYLALGDSETLRPGDWLMVIGSPLQLQNSVSVGVVSAKNRAINITADASLEAFIQTDAAINFGNSGGPLVDLQGRVVGIATAINTVAENIGFAVPVSTLKTILPQLESTGTVRRGYIGITIEDLDFESAEAFGLESTDGVLVNQLTPGGPAEKAGLKPGDIVLRVDDHKVRRNRDLIDYVSSKLPETEVEVEIYRDGEKKVVDVELGERPSNGAPVVEAEPEEESGIEWMGLQYQDLSPGLRSSHGMPDDLQGVFVTEVSPSSALFEENVRPGDVIAEVSGRSISGVQEFEEIVEGARSGTFLRLYIERFNPRSANSVAFWAFVRVP